MKNFYGDNSRWWLGRVIKGVDDEGDLSCQVRIFGIHSDNIPDKDLPFAKCVIPTTEGGVSGIGKIPQLQNGAYVFGFFLDGAASQAPIILGSMAHFGKPTATQKKKISEKGDSNALEDDKVFEGIITDKALINLYDNGNADFKTRQVIIMQFLIDNGLHEYAAAGVVGNLCKESTLNPEAKNENNRENSYGLAQWNANVLRKQDLDKHASKRNKPWEDFFVQLEFLLLDMKKNPTHKVFNHLADKKRTVTFEGVENSASSTWYFLTKYEVADYSVQDLIARETFAREAYDNHFESLRKSSTYKDNIS